MIKKWSYVAAMMLTASCGCLFTGCIDNDEPYGITQIRVATANLLEAKKAAVEAEAAAANAEVEVAKIKAEIEKQRLENEKAAAEAQAKINELLAQAEIAKTEAEAAILKAQAEQIAKQTEMEAKDRQAQIDRYIAETNDWIRKADQAYEALVYQWEQIKIKDAAAATDALFQAVDAAYQSYMVQLKEYNNLNKLYLEANRRLAAFELDLVWNPEGGNDGKGGFESPNYDQKALLETAVADAQNDIDSYNSSIDRLNNFKDELAQVVSKAGLDDLLSQYKEEQAQNAEDLIKANVEKDAIYLDNKALYDSRITLDNKIAEANAAPIAIAPYTYVPAADLSVLGIGETEIVPQGVNYSLDNIYNYNRYSNAYTNQIARLKRYLLDENDVAWTTARINELERQLKAENAIFEADKAAWEIAKKVYNMGNDVDASALPLETELEAAIADYNAMQGEIEGLNEAVKAAQEATDDARQAYNDAWNAYYDSETGTSALRTWERAQSDYNTARNDAVTAYREATTAARAAQTQTINDANAAVDNAWNAYYRAINAQSAAQNELDKDPTNKTLQENLEAAEKAVETAETNRDKAQENANKAIADATTKCERTIAAAYTARVKAINDAQETRDKAYAAWVASGEYNSIQNEPAYAPVLTAQENWEKAQEELTNAQEALQPAGEKMMELWQAMSDASQKQLEEIGLGYWSNNTIPYQWDAQRYAYGWSTDFPVASAPILYKNSQEVYTNAKQYLIDKSTAAYGSLGYTWNGDNNGSSHDYLYNLDVDQAFLVDNVTVDMMNAYIKAYYKRNYGWEPEDYQCASDYYRFGAFGSMSWTENRIAVAKANIANSNLVPDAVESLQANLDTMDADLVAAEDAVSAIQAERTDVENQINALNKNIDDKINDLNHVGNDLAIIISTIQNGIAQLQATVTAPSVEDVIGQITKNNVDTHIANLQNKLDEATTMLEKAKYQLDQYNAGYKDLENPYKPFVEYLQANVEAQKEYVELLKAHLEDVQAIYEKATKE